MRFYYCCVVVILIIYYAGIISLSSFIETRDDYELLGSALHDTLPSSSNPSSTKQQMIDVRRKCIDTIRARHKEFFSSNIVTKHISVLLVDPAYHGNVGDNMITLGEQEFLKIFNLTNHLEECHYHQAVNQVPPCNEVLSKTSATLALWQAGGNWGDLYVDIQSVRMKSFAELLNHGMSIIGMPQSLYYRNASLSLVHANLMRQSIMEALHLKDTTSPENLRLIKSKVMFTWREQESFDQAEILYPFATNKVIPDIAFQIGPFQPIPPKASTDMVDILVFLREDGESKFGQHGRSRGQIQQILEKIGKNATFTVVDWNSRWGIFGTKNILFDDTSIQLLSLGKVVICDRLHASILAYLSNLPVVYLDQKTNKLTNVLNVAFSSSHICNDKRNIMVKSLSLQDSLEKAIEILSASDVGKVLELDV